MKTKDKAVGNKIKLLRHEGKPEKQAVGEAMGMWKAGRLTTEGKYIRKGKK